MATEISLLQSGDVLGGVRVDDVIGIGGMAIVYRGQQLSLGRPVALKVLSSKLSSDRVFRERFRREGVHAATLEHPHIVPIYDSGNENGILYIVMRLVEGPSLAELIDTQGVSAEQAIEILRQMASALNAAHAAGLIHRDVKPQNILLTAQGHPYLTDFGIAKGSNSSLTVTGGFVGSVDYASPEHIGGLALTPASDVYSLTAVLYQCLAGAVPYPRETNVAVMHAHLYEPPPRLPAIEGLADEFDAVLATGMAKDPGSRYGSADELLEAAARAVGRLPPQVRSRVPALGAGSGGSTPARKRSGLHDTQVARGEGSISMPRPSLADVPAAPVTGHRRLRYSLVVGVAAIATLAATPIALLGAGSGRVHASVFRSGGLVLKANREWHRDNFSVPGLPIAKPVALATSDVRVAAGALENPGPVAAEPPTTLGRTYGASAQAGLTSLPLGSARRFVWERTDRRSGLVLLVIATSSAEIAIACSESTPRLSATKLVDQCGQIASAARVQGSKVEYPGADPTIQARLTQALLARDGVDSGALAELNSARLAARSQGLREIASARVTSAQLLATVRTSSRYEHDVRALIDALRAEGSLAARLADAAKADGRTRYAVLRTRFPAAEARVRSKVQDLQTRGFSSPPLMRTAIASVPPRPVHHIAVPAVSTIVQSPASRTSTATGSPAPVSPTPSTTRPDTTSGQPRPHESGQVIVTEPR